MGIYTWGKEEWDYYRNILYVPYMHMFILYLRIKTREWENYREISFLGRRMDKL